MPLLPRPAASASLVAELIRIVGADAVSVQDGDRLAYGRDAWTRDVLRFRAGQVGAAPEAVVWPSSAEELARVLDLANRRGIPVVPFGAGSGRVGGARPSRGGIALDLKRMRRIRRLEEQNLRVEAEAGVLGGRLERALEKRGYTLGHFPRSVGFSTVGGWLATRCAGDLASFYGKIEDMVFGIELAGPGRVRTLSLGPRPSRGADWIALTVGSEGCFGVFTSATLRIRPLPEARLLSSFRLRSVGRGVEALRRIMQAGLRPSLTRMFDAVDTRLGRSGPGSGEGAEAAVLEVLTPRIPDWLRGRAVERLRNELQRRATRAVFGAPIILNKALEVFPEDCLLILGFEGTERSARAELAVAGEILRAHGAEDIGSEPAETWFAHRYDVAHRETKLHAAGLFVDTLEVAATWDRLAPLHRAVKRAIGREAMVTSSFLHAYPEGCSIEFTFSGVAGEQGDLDEALERYDRIWTQALVAVHETGGTVSHHHGIGELKKAALPRELGPGGLRLLSALSRSFDPRGVLNPGKLILERFVPPRARPESVQDSLPKEIAAAVGDRNLLERAGRRVVRPPDERALAALLRVAHARGISLVSDQTAFERSARSVQVDLSRFEGVPRISEHSAFVECEAGVMVDRLETVLQGHGLTLGPLHPRAHEHALGAALARNLFLRRSIGFGDLKSLCFAVRGLLATGEAIETRAVPRSATGPSLDHLFLGAAGRFGVITKATLRVARRPRYRDTLRFGFAHFEQAVEVSRVAFRQGLRPIAARAWPEGEGGELAFELVAPTSALLTTYCEVLSTAATEEYGHALPPVSELATSGHFDTVVEVEAPWSRVLSLARGMEGVSWGEVWLDFMTPEAATVVVRARDEAARRAAIEVAVELGGRLVASSLETELSEVDRDLLASGVAHGAIGPFDDVAAGLAAALDPNHVLSGGGGP